jgi:phytoene synthase
MIIQFPHVNRRFINFFSYTANNSNDMHLEQAFKICAHITKTHSKSFYLSTAFLPLPKRRAIRALYAFCRTTDDIVDEPTSTQTPALTLDQWRAMARLPERAQTHPVLRAWANVRDEYAVPHHYCEELIDGCEMDLTISRYESWEDLRRYCYHVASTVGLISSHIIGMNNEDTRLFVKSKPAAIELGVALQLTNILRDVGEDLRRGRIYLPAEDMLRFNYTDDDLRNHVNDERFKALMRFEISRNRQLYEHSFNGIAFLQSDGRMAVGAAALLYKGILDEIELNDYNVFTQRARVSGRQKLARLPKIYLRVRGLPVLDLAIA